MLRLAEETGLLAVIAPDLAAQRGVPQNKVAGRRPLGPHAANRGRRPGEPSGRAAGRVCCTTSASRRRCGRPLPPSRRRGSPPGGGWLRRLRFPRAAADDVAHLVRHHMFWPDPTLSDAAVRRFLQRVGPRHLDNLFACGGRTTSAQDRPTTPAQAAFRARLTRNWPPRRPWTATPRHRRRRPDARAPPGARSALGQMIDALVERAVDDLALNERATLLLLAQGMLADMDDTRDR